MLKDRKVLLEQEIAELKTKCGKLYLKIVSGNAGGFDKIDYDAMKARLSDMMSDLDIVEHMIADGHE
jgi:hypothetical protein